MLGADSLLRRRRAAPPCSYREDAFAKDVVAADPDVGFMP